LYLFGAYAEYFGIGPVVIGLRGTNSRTAYSAIAWNDLIRNVFFFYSFIAAPASFMPIQKALKLA
jgi:hypothetical protein